MRRIHASFLVIYFVDFTPRGGLTTPLMVDDLRVRCWPEGPVLIGLP